MPRKSGSMSGEWKRSVSYRATPRLYCASRETENPYSSFPFHCYFYSRRVFLPSPHVRVS